MDVEVNEKKFTMRSEAKGIAAKVFRACKVSLPPLLQIGNCPAIPTPLKMASAGLIGPGDATRMGGD